MMKKIFNLLLVISMITNSCTKNDSVTTKIYGEGKDRMKSSSARVDIAAYTDFEKLYDRLEEIACNDSIPSIAIQKRDTVKVIHLLNPCWEDHACILVKERNILKILNDSIFKANKSYSINQMTKVLKKDYNNFGKEESYSYRPEKLIIYITVDNNYLPMMETVLDKIVSAYDALQSSTSLNISIRKRIIPPPPPITF